MPQARIFLVSLFLLLPALAAAERPVSVVCALFGEVAVTPGNGVESTELALFDRLSPGAEVRTAVGAKVVLAFFNGRRFALGEDSIGRVEEAALSGAGVEELAAVPAIAQIAPLAEAEAAGKQPGAIRVRSAELFGRQIENLQPSAGTSVLPDAATLSFDPVAGADRYQVELEDETGNTVLSLETRSPRVEIPPGVLATDVLYYWQVRTLGSGRTAVRGEGRFMTPTSRDLAARAALVERVEAADDLDLLLLLAEVDRSLGLWQEACNDLRRAAVDYRQDPRWVRALEVFRCAAPDPEAG